ncbi:hypothetical protein DL990_12815 [Amycolatopsis sp. WAC 01416]|uniref:hypothetical protein n=1 Tax=Amycolatopsis sp. WAC 01416 TaxID=2203196 RepID=UPI000F7B5B05|nr:hypothetical protein [Amycolatopsis sp. WAC 01416]RSN34530.1 hypothetical protein DL990_12815 [Amycolatopsis sp. WAC 01416]
MDIGLVKRCAAAGVAAVALSVSVSAPAAASPAPGAATCSYQVTPVAVPPGAERQRVDVVATDGAGNYSGTEIVGSSGAYRLVLWHGDDPETVEPPKGFDSVAPRSQNRSGTVLVNAVSVADRKRQIFLYRDGNYEPLAIPDGFVDPRGVAINDLGEIVATANPVGGTGSVVIAWLSHAAGPVIIAPPELPYASAVDIDQDGTIMLGDGYSAYLWRAGKLTALPPSPEVPVLSRGISAGRAVGTILDAKGPKGVVWTGNIPELLEGGGAAESINRHGLIAGRARAWDGPPVVWQGTRLAAELPLPAGSTSARADLVSDDGTVFGNADAGAGPVHWRCAVR